MTHTELQKLAAGRFSKVAQTEKSIIIGTYGDLFEKGETQEIVRYIAGFYGVNNLPDKFGYGFITADKAVEKGCKLPVNNYNDFIEIYK